MKMLKILIILIRKQGGVATANKEIAEVLRKKGHKVDFLSREDDLGIYSLGKSILPLRKKVRELMLKENYDIVYTQDYSCALPLLFPTKLLFREKHFNCLIGKKRNMKGQRIHKFLQDWVGKKMENSLIVINDYNHKRFPKSHLVYRGVNLERFKPLNLKRDCLGFVDKFSEQLSKEEYIKIAKSLKLKPIWAGRSGPSKAVDKAYGKTIVHSFDKIQDEKMNEFYNRCKVFVNLPGGEAGFNISWLEAMGNSVPIIIGNEEGAGKILPIYKIKNPNEIKKIVKNHEKDFDYRQWIIDNDFTWDRVTKQLIEIFEKGTK